MISPIIRLFPPQYPAPANGSTPEFDATITDNNGAVVPAASLSALTLSIVDTRTSVIINGCNKVNILNTSRGAVDTQGKLKIVLTALDTAMLNPLNQQEERSLIIDFTYNGGTAIGRQELRFILQQLSGP